jgi:high-affinity iron transporter
VARVLRIVPIAALVVLAAAPAARAAAPAWQSAGRAREQLFDARDRALLGDRPAARRDVRAAGRAVSAALRAGLAAADPAAARDARAALRAAAAAAARGDAVALAAADGRARAALLRAAATAAIAAAGRGDARAAGELLLLRDFRTATRYTRPGVDATRAVDGLAAGRVRPAAARLAVAKDLLDAYQAKLRELLDDAAAAAGKRFTTGAAAASAQAAGYWAILRDRYRQDLGPAALRPRRRGVRAVRPRRAPRGRRRARRRPPPGRQRAAGLRRRAIHCRRGGAARPAAPALPRPRAGRVRPRGEGRRVTLDFEIAEAAGFRDGAAAAFSDLEGKLARRDRARTASVERGLDRLRAIVATAQRTGAAAPQDEVKATAAAAAAQLRATFPPAWRKRTDDADLDLVAVTLDRLDAAVSSGQWKLAEQARLEAYAFIEFGPSSSCARSIPASPSTSRASSGSARAATAGSPS